MLKPGDTVEILGKGIFTKVLEVDNETMTITLACPTKGIEPGDLIAYAVWHGLDRHPL